MCRYKVHRLLGAQKLTLCQTCRSSPARWISVSRKGTIYMSGSMVSKNSFHLKYLLVITLSILLLSSSNLFAATSNKCPGQQGYHYTNDKSKRNPRKGGFVSNSANVGDYVFIAPTAAVCDSATVLKYARIYGNAIVKGEAEVTGKARVYGNAIVSGEAVVSDNAKVSGHAHITGSAEVKGTAWVKGYTVLRGGIRSKGKFSAKKPKSVLEKERRMAFKKMQNERKVKNAEMIREAKWKLESFQRDLNRGWYGRNEREGYYRKFKYIKSDVKPPCGFYLKVEKEERTLDSHCRRTKRVRRKRWTPDGGYFKTVKDCPTRYESKGEQYFNFKKLRVNTRIDFANKRNYLVFNDYYFYIGNARKTNEYRNKLKSFAEKYCR